MKSRIAGVSLGLCAALPAFAGTVFSTGSLPMYGANYTVTSWRISGDAGPNTINFGAEGMTFFNGTLYVSHDHNADRAAGNLVLYTPGPTGNLSAPSTILFGNGPAGLWGPEGITINDSGQGYGSWTSGAVRLASLDTRGTGAFGVFDTGAPGSNLTDTISPTPVSLDDLAWAGSISMFAGIEQGPVGTAFLRMFDRDTMALQPFNAQVIDGAKGLAVVSGSFAASLTGLSVSTAQAFLVVSEFDGFAFYDTNGAAIGPALFFSGYAPITELESVAVDEANNLIFLGDEAGRAIHVVAVPAPGAGVLVGLGSLLALRRRR